MDKTKISAIILAAGRGSRMKREVHKQYLLMDNKPVIYYSLKAFEESSVDEIILVAGQDEEEYCRKEIIEKYQFRKVKAIVSGGKERYHSVYNGLCGVNRSEYVLIHDGARPFITVDVIEKNIAAVKQENACVTAVPSKDTIKIADSSGYIKETPDRNKVWIIQTPQTFRTDIIKSAYEKIIHSGCAGITDDAMVLETVSKQPVKLIHGDYKNIKITTPDDLLVGEMFLREEALNS